MADPRSTDPGPAWRDSGILFLSGLLVGMWTPVGVIWWALEIANGR